MYNRLIFHEFWEIIIIPAVGYFLWRSTEWIFSNKVAPKSNTTVVKIFYLQIHEYYWLIWIVGNKTEPSVY